jgi:hypothetical protein
VVTTSNYKAVANSCTRLLTTADTESSQFVFTSRFLVTVVESGCVCGVVLLMGCYLEKYRARLGTWTARTSWRTAQGRESNGQAISYMGNMLLCTAALTALLVIGGVEQNADLVWRLRTVCKYCVVGVRGI